MMPLGHWDMDSRVWTSEVIPKSVSEGKRWLGRMVTINY